MTQEQFKQTLIDEPLSLNEILLLENLIERMNKEISLEEKSDSDLRLCINHIKIERLSHYAK